MKPITMSAMVAGVQAGRISAVFVISSVPCVDRQPDRLPEIEMGKESGRFKTNRPETGQSFETI